MTSYRPPLFEAAAATSTTTTTTSVSGERWGDENEDAEESEEGEVVVARPPQINWETAQAVLYVVQERVAAAIGRPVEFDEGHVAYLQSLFLRDTMSFWTVVDQVHERMISADWSPVRDDPPFIHSLISRIKPIPCDVPEPEFVQMLLAKLWPPHQPGSGSGQGARRAPAAATTEVQEKVAHEQMIALAVANVYTWQAAVRVMEGIGERLTGMVGRQLGFDEKHRTHLRARYDEDPLGFWSVLDQVQERMTEADWDGVRNDARFIQSFVNKFEPLDVPLSDYMASAIPQHSLVPYGYPPHVLRSRSFGPVAAAAAAAAAVVVPQHPPAPHAPVSNQAAAPPALAAPAAPAPFAASAERRRGTPASSAQSSPHKPPQSPQKAATQQALRALAVASGDPNYPFTWKAALASLDAVEAKVLKACGHAIKFDEKHKLHLRHRWEQDPKGFFSIVDQIQERLVQSDWGSIRGTARFIQSLVSRFEPQSVLSKFMQAFITPPEMAAVAAAADASTAEYSSVTWEEVMDVVFPAVEQRATKSVGRLVLFDEKHKLHMKQRFDRDAGAFWSILDQVQERMALSDWSTVRDDGRFIQSFITKAEPQLPLELGEFLKSVISTLPSGHKGGGAPAPPHLP